MKQAVKESMCKKYNEVDQPFSCIGRKVKILLSHRYNLTYAHLSIRYYFDYLISNLRICSISSKLSNGVSGIPIWAKNKVATHLVCTLLNSGSGRYTFCCLCVSI